MQKKTLRQAQDDILEDVAKKHGVDEVYEISIPVNDSGEEAKAYMKYPSLNAYSVGMTLEDTNPLKGKLIVLNDMFLEGDRRMLEPEKSTLNMKIFLRACTQIDGIIDLRMATLKKKSMTQP